MKDFLDDAQYLSTNNISIYRYIKSLSYVQRKDISFGLRTCWFDGRSGSKSIFSFWEKKQQLVSFFFISMKLFYLLLEFCSKIIHPIWIA